MREGFGKDGAWVWVDLEALEEQQQQDAPQGESDPGADVPSAQRAAPVTSPPIAPAQPLAVIARSEATKQPSAAATPWIASLRSQ